jgi:hypothetical protein
MSDFVFSAAQSTPNPHQAKKPPDPPKHPTPKISFRDKLLGPSQEIPVREKQNLIEKNLVRIELENGNRLLPKVYIEPSTFQELCTPWKDALVVKLLGKNLSYHAMKERLQKVWKTQSGFEIMDNGNGFYMVKFDQAADKEKVVTGGPWMIFDHCLSVTHWSPEFASPDAKIERTVVWVRFPGLNLVYYDESFLMAMASAIGRPIKVDTNTLNVERGKFARVCVEVDLTVPVVGKIWLNGHWYKVQYEGLHLICTNCGCYGHLGRNCVHTPTSSVAAKPPTPHNDTGNQNVVHQPPPETSNGNHSSQNQNDLSAFNGKITSIDDGTKDLHGDWLLVTRRKKVNNNPNFNAQKAAKTKSNRFSSLSNLAHQEESTPQPNLPPRPKPNDIQRTSKSAFDPKRRRQDSSGDTIMNQSLKVYPTSDSNQGPTTQPNFQSNAPMSQNSSPILELVTIPPHVTKPIPSSNNQNITHPTPQNSSKHLHVPTHNTTTPSPNPPHTHVLPYENTSVPPGFDTTSTCRVDHADSNDHHEGVRHHDEDMGT